MNRLRTAGSFWILQPIKLLIPTSYALRTLIGQLKFKITALQTKKVLDVFPKLNMKIFYTFKIIIQKTDILSELLTT